MLTTPHSYPVSNHRSTVRLKNKLLNPDIYCSSRWRGLLASPHLTAAAIFYKAFLKPISSTLSSSKTANLLKFALIFLLLIAIQPCQGTHKISQKNSYPSKISNAKEMQPWFVKRVAMLTTIDVLHIFTYHSETSQNLCKQSSQWFRFVSKLCSP